MSGRFRSDADGSIKRYETIHDTIYEIYIPYDILVKTKRRTITNSLTNWLRKKREYKHIDFTYGMIREVEHIPEQNIHQCSKCNKTYKTRSGYLKHINKYHPISAPVESVTEDFTPTNERTTDPPPTAITHNITNSNNTNQHIHINLPSPHNFGDENPKWLTSDVILRAIQDIPTAIPNLIKEKHFNDKFPENQNVRLENKRSIKKRLKVFAEGRWCLKDRPELEYQLVEQVYDVLDEFIDMMTEDANEEDIDDEASPIDKRIAHITRRIRASEMRSRRVRRVLGDWERFKDTIQDEYEKTVEPFKDKIDTFLLDNELRLEQLRERRAMLTGGIPPP